MGMQPLPQATVIALIIEERKTLEALAGSRKSEARMRERARIVLLAASGVGSPRSCTEVGRTPGTVSKWRVRYASDRMAGLSETGDRGAEPGYGPEHGRLILAMLDQAPPGGYSNWTAPLLAREPVDIHEQYIWRFLRAQKIDLSGRKSWCESTDPEFVSKAADIVGLYMSPPDNAVVLSVDEKPSIQALERAQGYLKPPNGRSMIGQSHDYKRNGTTLFAARNVGTGEVTGRHYKRRRRLAFLDFMNRMVKQYQGKEIRVVLHPVHALAKAGLMAGAAPERSIPLYPDTYVLVEPDRDMVLHPVGEITPRGIVRKRARADRPHRCLHRKLQRRGPVVRLDQERRPSEGDEAVFPGLTILGSRAFIFLPERGQTRKARAEKEHSGRFGNRVRSGGECEIRRTGSFVDRVRVIADNVIRGNAKECEFTGQYRVVESRIHCQIVGIVDVSVSSRNLGRIPVKCSNRCLRGGWEIGLQAVPGLTHGRRGGTNSGVAAQQFKGEIP